MSSISTPTKANRQQQQQNAVTPEEEGENSSRRKRKQEEGEDEVEANPVGGGNGGSESANAPSADEDSDDELAVLGTKVNNEIINAIVTARMRSGNDVDVVAEAMHDLRYLISPKCDNYEENRQFAILCGALVVIVNAMSRHVDSYQVQGYGCNLLGGIISHPPSSTMASTGHIERDIINIGGLAQCLAAMDRYIHQPSLQFVGCKLIGMLWCRVPKSVIEAGGPGAVVRAMVTHKQHVQVQHFGFYALKKLLCCGHYWMYTTSLVDAGFIEVVIGTMERYEDDVFLQREGCKSLYAFAKRHEHFRDRIIKCKGLAAVFKARQVHKAHVCVLVVAEEAIKAISGLVQHET